MCYLKDYYVSRIEHCLENNDATSFLALATANSLYLHVNLHLAQNNYKDECMEDLLQCDNVNDCNDGSDEDSAF